MTDAQIEIQRAAGAITLVLKHGTAGEIYSLLRAIEQLCGAKERRRLERWMHEGMPDA